jgi:LysM repeat protein
MNKFWLLLLAVFFTFGLQAQESIPDRFINHKVKKKETLYSLSQKYGVTVDQIEAYNPTLIKSRLKLKMTLRIPVYEAPVVIEEVISETESYLVPPKATKWRIAYTYGITIQELEALNPSLKEGLKAGQTLQVPITTKDTLVGPSSAFNYYTVLPKEGYYRIEKKLGIGQRILDSLNPELAITGLQAGMVLKVPLEFSGDLKVQDDLLVPKVDLLDSLSPLDRALKIGLLLPFKAQTLELDSLEKTKSLLKKRNLTRLAFDFYAGVRMALEVLAEKGVATELQVFDTQNKRAKLNQLVQTSELTAQDLLVGPLIPRNFDFISAQGRLRKIPKVAPLSYKKVQMRANVYQSIPPKQILRERMLSHLDNVLTEEENVVVVADSLNRDIEKILMERYPYAIRFRPEQGGYLDSELMDSLLLDSIPNKIILESENFSLISSISSQLSGKITPSRPIQLFRIYFYLRLSS